MSGTRSTLAQADKELGDVLINSTELSDEELAEALKILSAHLSDHKITQIIHEEIERLAEQALTLEKSFGNVKLLLEKIAEASERDMKRDVTDMSETWVGYSNNYVEFLWKSRQVAGKAEAAAKDFASDFVDFLKEDDVKKKEKRDEINNYLENLDRGSSDSKQLQEGLHALRDGIKQFAKDWKDLVHKYHSDIGIDEWTQLDKDVTELTNALWTLRLKIERLSRSMGVIVSTNGVSSILAALCPILWTEIMVATLKRKGSSSKASSKALTDAESEVRTIQRELEQKTAQRDSVARRLTGTKALHADVGTSEMGIADFCDKLTAIGSVWDTIREDLKIISGLLDFTKGDLSKQLFDLRLDTTASLYNTLATALHHYQVVVTMPDSAVQKRHL
ncbi:hypothetical protein EUX98_g769 [Antrodiella citrinella]|uniref:Uncharacterized protein n=1 Tax=Antrodiella citrinella TaxID=2447956 RepID=A0A4S4N395_9APHY|nr:hypothetical protein EUX98_g769 [Antrodiella citrinella]